MSNIFVNVRMFFEWFIDLVSLAMGAQPTSDEVWDMTSPSNLWYLLLQGTVVLPLSFGLLTLAPRYLSAPEVSLFLLIGADCSCMFSIILDDLFTTFLA
mgnify:CR=1 FL=1